jgi:hypothetical protein
MQISLESCGTVPVSCYSTLDPKQSRALGSKPSSTIPKNKNRIIVIVFPNFGFHYSFNWKIPHVVKEDSSKFRTAVWIIIQQLLASVINTDTCFRALF